MKISWLPNAEIAWRLNVKRRLQLQAHVLMLVMKIYFMIADIAWQLKVKRRILQLQLTCININYIKYSKFPVFYLAHNYYLDNL